MTVVEGSWAETHAWVHRVGFSPMLGHYGQAAYGLTPDARAWSAGICPEALLGHGPLPDGTMLRVEVTVVSIPPEPAKVNGWHIHNGTPEDRRRWHMNTRGCRECETTRELEALDAILRGLPS